MEGGAKGRSDALAKESFPVPDGIEDPGLARGDGEEAEAGFPRAHSHNREERMGCTSAQQAVRLVVLEGLGLQQVKSGHQRGASPSGVVDGDFPGGRAGDDKAGTLVDAGDGALVRFELVLLG